MKTELLELRQYSPKIKVMSLSLFSPDILLVATEKGVIVELPIAQLEDESAADIRTMIDQMNLETNQIVIRFAVVLSGFVRS